ncbi:Ser/Thr protein phosphatase family protein [Reticulomyxa filosa]|uniref:Ser/Thr protein phosphatase family protein n=1 Tax=Reticulomyxa filosa TaxID=46433 RepID=X6N1W3_RETFI|nr:Ser/Thr protein phosphatase family protein [Reticulomyxa filosa]|eukprot:ETO19302.1 Ser/Thr protein phosphatase family protein [Reticulomyxa filosa]
MKCIPHQVIFFLSFEFNKSSYHTHNGHEHLTNTLKQLYDPNKTNVLIHAGDMTNSGKAHELEKFNQWLSHLPFEHKLIISGNMDGIGLDRKSFTGHQLFTSALYLENESVNIDGINFFGTPYSPKFVGGFQLLNTEQTIDTWKKIPANTNVLIVHGPPFGILDKTSSGTSVGCPVLYDIVVNNIKPKVVIFGHVHYSFGQMIHKGIRFFNVAQFDGIHGINPFVKPVVIEL